MAEMSRPSTSSGLVEEGLSQASESESQAQLRDELSIYEVGFHVVPTIPEVEVGAVVERIKKALAAAGASVIAEEFPKRITFTYRIERRVAGRREKYTEGYFGWIKFESSATAVASLHEVLRSDASILRFLLIHAEREVQAPTPRAVFSSDRLEGETIAKPISAPETPGEVSEEELEKSLEAIVGE